MATKSVLIVDDAAETRIFLKGVVASMGLTSFEAKTGIDALKLLNDHQIDLVILDILMPNLDGYQTLEAINKLKKDRDIKVVFLTGKRGELDQAKIESLKPDDLIHKTVEIQVLKTKLKKILDGTAPPKHSIFPEAAPTPQPKQAIFPSSQNTNGQITVIKGGSTPQPQATPQKPPAAPAQNHAESKFEMTAKVTNLPIDLEVKISKLTQTNITFQAKFQFKEGAQLSIDCPKAAASLKKTGEFSVKVLKCTAEQDSFQVNAQII